MIKWTDGGYKIYIIIYFAVVIYNILCHDKMDGRRVQNN